MTPTDDTDGRVADLDGLKALAHPLRVQIIESLSTYGPHTASTLGDRLGESSGATSYHLRQLEKHGYVREVEGRGTARERWWERTPGPIMMGGPALEQSEAGKQASRVIMREWLHHREAGVRDIVERGMTELDERWQHAIMLHSASVHVTAEQLDELNEQIFHLVSQFAATHRGQRVVRSRPVQIQYFAFPVLDGHEITEEDAS
jgi:DNA-binding transcriptional ArsR family regulator